MKTLEIVLISLLLCPTFALAQADRIGSGGSWSEGDLKHLLARLGTYLESEEGKKAFSEIVDYNAHHSEETVGKIAFELNPRLIDNKVHDSKGNERDCVSYLKPIRYFECTLTSLPPKPEENANNGTKSEYYGSLYRLVFHELLVQTGLEKPVSKEIPSQYPISSRLLVHLENFPEWVPGAGDSGVYSENEVVVHTHLQTSGALNVGRGFQNDKFFTGFDLRLEAPVTLSLGNFRFGIDVSFEYAVDGSRASAGTLLAVTQYDLPQFGAFHPYLRFGMGFASFYDRFTYDGDHHYYEGSSQAILNIVAGTRFGNKEQYFVDFTVANGHTFVYENMATVNFGIQF